jgi:hypothetical protein
MLSLIHSAARAFIAALLMGCLLSLAAPRAAAADRLSESDKSAGREVPPPTEAGSANGEVKMPRVSYAAFDVPLTPPAESAPEPASRPRSVARLIASVNATAKPAPMPLPPPQSTVASTAPMTAGEKFEYWFHSRFLSFGPFGTAVVNGMWKELQDNDDFKEDTVGNFFADSMTRAARSYTFGTTAGFFEKAVFASLFRQDPRYHRSGKTSAGGKIGYAVTRVFVTQGDRCACHQFNASFLLGGAAASGIANLWERRERTGPMHTLSRYYNHIAITALYNVVKEFVGGQ